MHHRNIQVLATEFYKIVNGLSPEIMKEVFPFNDNTTYNTRSKRKLYSRAIKSVTFCSETLSHLAPKIWELVPVEIKNWLSVLRGLLRNGNQGAVLVVYGGCMFFTLVSCNLLYDTPKTCFSFLFISFNFVILVFSFLILDS